MYIKHYIKLQSAICLKSTKKTHIHVNSGKEKGKRGKGEVHIRMLVVVLSGQQNYLPIIFVSYALSMYFPNVP